LLPGADARQRLHPRGPGDVAGEVRDGHPGRGGGLRRAQEVVDVTNSPSFEDGPMPDFFTRSTTTQLAAEREAGVGHLVALSIAGTDRLPDAGGLPAGRGRPGGADHRLADSLRTCASSPASFSAG
jgi:hypothetical protein